MSNKYYEDLSKETIADLHVAIYESREQMNICLRNKDIKGFLRAFKINLQLNKLLDKKSFFIRKGNDSKEKQR